MDITPGCWPPLAASLLLNCFQKYAGHKLFHSLIQLNPILFTEGGLKARVFEVHSNPKWAILSYLFPWFYLVNLQLLYNLSCCAHGAISLLWIAYTKITIVCEHTLGLELCQTLFHIKSVPAGRTSELLVFMACLFPKKSSLELETAAIYLSEWYLCFMNRVLHSWVQSLIVFSSCSSQCGTSTLVACWADGDWGHSILSLLPRGRGLDGIRIPDLFTYSCLEENFCNIELGENKKRCQPAPSGENHCPGLGAERVGWQKEPCISVWTCSE